MQLWCPCLESRYAEDSKYNRVFSTKNSSTYLFLSMLQQFGGAKVSIPLKLNFLNWWCLTYLIFFISSCNHTSLFAASQLNLSTRLEYCHLPIIYNTTSTVGVANSRLCHWSLAYTLSFFHQLYSSSFPVILEFSHLPLPLMKPFFLSD